MIRTLVFDLDDTLFPERAFVFSGFEAVDGWLRKEMTIHGFLQQASAEFNAGARGDIFNLALRHLGAEDDPVVIRQMVEIYRAHRPRIALFADAAWALTHFGRRMELALLTDGYLAVQQRKVAALGIAERFAAIVYSDELGRNAWKPSQVPYTRVMSLLRRHGSECVYVADNPAKDFVAAKALGWDTIQIRRREGECVRVQVPPSYEADQVIASLCELRRVLA